MPSVTPRTHGGHGWPPPLVPRIEPRVLRAMPMSRRIPDLIRPAPADAADPDTVHAHLLTAVHQPPEPARAPAWTRQRLTTASRRARRAGPRPNAAPKGRPEPEDRRAAAGVIRLGRPRGHECLDHGCESGWVVTSEARMPAHQCMPSGSATSSSPTGGGHCSALYVADVSASPMCAIMHRRA